MAQNSLFSRARADTVRHSISRSWEHGRSMRRDAPALEIFEPPALPPTLETSLDRKNIEIHRNEATRFPGTAD